MGWLLAVSTLLALMPMATATHVTENAMSVSAPRAPSQPAGEPVGRKPISAATVAARTMAAIVWMRLPTT